MRLAVALRARVGPEIATNDLATREALLPHIHEGTRQPARDRGIRHRARVDGQQDRHCVLRKRGRQLYERAGISNSARYNSGIDRIFQEDQK